MSEIKDEDILEKVWGKWISGEYKGESHEAVVKNAILDALKLKDQKVSKTIDRKMGCLMQEKSNCLHCNLKKELGLK